ncbi:MAG: hypothetical protein U5M51_01560 [Emticicia sp.]|nr:hypothetical protein [Emticicia sp.]
MKLLGIHHRQYAHNCLEIKRLLRLGHLPKRESLFRRTENIIINAPFYTYFVSGTFEQPNSG